MVMCNKKTQLQQQEWSDFEWRAYELFMCMATRCYRSAWIHSIDSEILWMPYKKCIQSVWVFRAKLVVNCCNTALHTFNPIQPRIDKNIIFFLWRFISLFRTITSSSLPTCTHTFRLIAGIYFLAERRKNRSKLKISSSHTAEGVMKCIRSNSACIYLPTWKGWLSGSAIHSRFF